MTSLSSAYIRARQAAFLVKHAYLKLYLLEGEFQGEKLRMLVADDGSTLPYISSMAFGDGADIHYKGKISAIKAPGLAASDADVVVVGANLLLGKLFRKRGFHLAPKWLNPVFPTTEPPDNVVERLNSETRRKIKQEINRVKRLGYQWEPTKDDSWFHEFYHKMYKPSAVNRYGELVQLDGYRRVKRVFDCGTGIVIKQDGETVAGTVIYKRGDILRAPYKGMMNGDDSISRAGASQAIYYFVMQISHSWSCSAVNFGSTRPFMSDGALRYKLKWGMSLTHDELATAAFAIAAPRSNDPARRFLSANPFFEVIGRGFELYKPVWETVESA